MFCRIPAGFASGVARFGNVCNGWKPHIRLAWLSCTGGHLRDAHFLYSLDRLFRVISMYSLSAILVLTLTKIQNTNKN